MDEYYKPLNQEYITKYQTLSEKFIAMHYKDGLNWNHISKYQTLSEPFIIQCIEQYNKLGEIFYINIARYQKISMTFKYLDMLPVCDVIKYQHVSIDYINKHSIFKDELKANKLLRRTYTFTKRLKISIDTRLPDELGERLIDKKITDIKILT
jgi:hypothetical protein